MWTAANNGARACVLKLIIGHDLDIAAQCEFKNARLSAWRNCVAMKGAHQTKRGQPCGWPPAFTDGRAGALCRIGTSRCLRMSFFAKPVSTFAGHALEKKGARCGAPLR
jgi:hypothetical protein